MSNHTENLKQACAKESTFTIRRKIPKQAIIFVAPPLEWKLDKSGGNPHLTKCSQEDKLTSAERRVCRDKFSTSIRWNKYDTLRFTQQYGKAILEQENKSYRTGHKWQSQFFTDYPKDSPIYGIEAPKQWWLQTGLGDTLTGKDGLNNFEDFGMARTDKLFYLPLSQSLSTYQFNTSEISTLSDLGLGLRRFKLALIDKQTNEMIAEYIGFDSSSHAPGHSFGGYDKELSEVNCITQLLGEPLRRRFERDNPPAEKVFKYFFEQVLDDNAVQSAPRVYHYP